VGTCAGSFELRADHHGGARAAHAVGVVQQPKLQGVTWRRATRDGRSCTCLADRPLMALSANTAGELRSVKLSAMITLLPGPLFIKMDGICSSYLQRVSEY
jgi:hypothetical protein